MNDLKVNHIIIEAKKELDYLFILPHAGVEYADAPVPELIARYRDFIDYGADGVIASHPHCPQGWETYKGKPIFYSLGNFLFNSKNTYDFVAQRPHWYEGLCVKLNLCDGEISYEIINIRNVNNRMIVIDNTYERVNHNEFIYQIINDKDKYDVFFKKLLINKKDGLYINSIIFLDNGFKDYIKIGLALLRYKKNKLNTSSNYYITFKNDATTSLTKRILKINNK